MLQSIRDNSKGVISYILIGFLVVIFALFGVESLFNWNPTANKVVEVNGEKITQVELQNAIARQKQQMMNRYGDQVPSEFLSEDYLRKPVLDNLIQNQVLYQAAKKAGMTVGNDLIAEQISSAPVFKNEAGVFDNTRYRQALSMMGYTHATYTQQLAKDLVLNQLYTGLASSSFTTPNEIEQLIALSYQTRDFSYFVLPSSKIKESVVVSDEEIADYYAKNPQAYTSEEQVAVDYIELSVDALVADISISEEQLHKQYEQGLASFVAAPERHAAHILVENKDAEKIKAVREKLAAGEDFAELAKTYSDDLGSKEQGGDLGFTKGDTFPAEFETALAGLKVGEVSAPVETDAGTHFIKLLAERGSQAPSFEEQKASLEEHLKRAEAENIFVAKLEQLKELAFNADSLAEVAKEIDAKVSNTGLFSRTSGQGIAANKLVADAAFSEDVLQDGNSSEPIELDTTRAVVIKKTDYQPSRLLPLDEVKQQIVGVLTESKARELMRAKGSQLLADLHAGKALGELASAEGQALKTAAAAKRYGSDVEPEIAGFAFDMAKPTAEVASVAGFVTASGDYALIQLAAVNLGAEEIAEEQKKAIVAQVGNMNGLADFSSFQGYLKEVADIDQ